MSTPQTTAARVAQSLRPLILFALLIAAWSFAKSWNYAGRWTGIDYYGSWVVGDALRTGITSDIYDKQEQQRLSDLYRERATGAFNESGEQRATTKRMKAALLRPELQNYPTPWFYTCFALTTTGRYSFDQSLFQRASLCAYVVALIVLCRMLGYGAPECAVAVAALLEAFGPYLEDSSLGNVGRMQIAALVSIAWLLSRSFTLSAGLVIGLLVAFKPNVAAVPVVLGLAWSISGQWGRLTRVVIGAIVGVLVAVAWSSTYIGSLDCWVHWTRELREFLQSGQWQDVNFSVARVLHDVVGVASTGWLRWVVAAIVLSVLWRSRERFIAAVRQGTESPSTAATHFEIFLIGLGGMLPILMSELAWFHYYLFTLPLSLYLLRPRADAPALRYLFAFVALLAISLDAPRMLFNLSVEAHMSVAAAGAVLLFALACRDALSREVAAAH